MVSRHKKVNGYYRWDDFFHLNQKKEKPKVNRISEYAKHHVRRCDRLGYECDTNRLRDLADWALSIDRPSEAITVYELLFKKTKDEHKRDLLSHIIKRVANYAWSLYDENPREIRYLDATIHGFQLINDDSDLTELIVIEENNGHLNDVLKELKKYHLSKKERIIKTLKEISSKKDIKEIPLPKEEPILMVSSTNLESKLISDKTYAENYIQHQGVNFRE